MTISSSWALGWDVVESKYTSALVSTPDHEHAILGAPLSLPPSSRGSDFFNTSSFKLLSSIAFLGLYIYRRDEK